MVRPPRSLTFADDGSDRGEWQHRYVLNALSYNIQDKVWGPTDALCESDPASRGNRRSLRIWRDGGRRSRQCRRSTLRLLLGQEHRGSLVDRHLGGFLRNIPKRVKRLVYP